MPRDLKPFLTEQEYRLEYEINGKSPRMIAKERGTTHTKVIADLKHYNIAVRNQSESQKTSQSRGRAYNPTKGRNRTLAEREAIGEALIKHHDNKPYKDKVNWNNRLRTLYNRMSDEQKAEFHHKAKIALLESGKYGSKLEKYLWFELSQMDYKVILHSKHIISNDNMHIDLLLPDKKIAIECDGIAHLQDIYNEPDKFAKKVARDIRKDGLLLQAGYSVIRIKYAKKLSMSRMKVVLEKLVSTIERMGSRCLEEITID